MKTMLQDELDQRNRSRLSILEKRCTRSRREWLEKKTGQEFKSFCGTIMPRLLKIGEEELPREEFSHLEGIHLKIFLTVEDHNEWPPEMAHLKKYILDESDALPVACTRE